MGFFRQFETFNPLNGNVPTYPFSILPSIAFRARTLLKSRAKEQIIDAAHGIDWAIDEYFSEIKQEEISRLKHELDPSGEEFEKYFEWDGGTVANGKWIFKDSNQDELDIVTAENTTEVDALKNCIGWWDDIGGEDFLQGKSYELFAVLALWLLADALHWLQNSQAKTLKSISDFSPKLAQDIERIVSGFPPDLIADKSTNLSLAGESALNAMDAVCYAEHLFAVEKLKVTQEVERQVQEKKRRSMLSEKLNIARHQKRNQAVGLVTSEWAKNPSQFNSAEKAGLHYAEWLKVYDFQFEPRTITGWLRTYAKKVGIRLR